MFIRQISVYLENIRGSLCELTQLLGEKDINLLALSVADTSGFGIVRIIVRSSELERASLLLREAGYIAKQNSVVCVSIPHRPLGLAGVLRIMDEHDISVEYTYSIFHCAGKEAALVIRPSEKDRCAALLTANGIRLFSQDEVDSF